MLLSPAVIIDPTERQVGRGNITETHVVCTPIFTENILMIPLFRQTISLSVLGNKLSFVLFRVSEVKHCFNCIQPASTRTESWMVGHNLGFWRKYCLEETFRLTVWLKSYWLTIWLKSYRLTIWLKSYRLTIWLKTYRLTIYRLNMYTYPNFQFYTTKRHCARQMVINRGRGKRLRLQFPKRVIITHSRIMI